MKIYVGCCGSVREVFRSQDTPTAQTHGHQYNYAIGPFRTVRAAQFMALHGYNNPHLRCVADAERISKMA
jgi:hypothetical protein